MITTRLAALSLALCLAAGAALAQVPNAQPPYNTPSVAVIPQANRSAATVRSAAQTALDKAGVTCRLHQNLAGVSSGSPSTTFGIETYDAVAQSWLQMAVSGAVTTAADYDLQVYPGAVATSVPSNTAIFGLHLSNTWRAFITVAGTGAPNITSGVDCGYLR